MNSQKTYEYTVKYGTYYYPASKHYPSMMNPIVQCDRCKRNHLSVCIGWEEYDMCLECVSKVQQMIRDPPRNPIRPPISHGPGSVRPSIMTPQGWCGTCEPSKTVIPSGPRVATNMEQSQFRPERDDPEVATFMMQDQFNWSDARLQNDIFINNLRRQNQNERTNGTNGTNDDSKPVVRTRMEQFQFRRDE